MSERRTDSNAPDAFVEISDDAIAVDAAALARELRLSPDEVRNHMRAGTITCVCERGEDEDAGRYRLTFFHEGRRLRLIVEDTGRVVQRSLIDFGERPLPESLRRFGTQRSRDDVA